jgi:hypothetical protein
VVDRCDEAFGEVGVGQPRTGVEVLRWHQQRPREALGLLLVVDAARSLPGVDRVAVDAQGGDEASFGVVGLERLDVGGVVDALGGQGGDTAAVNVSRTPCLGRLLERLAPRDAVRQALSFGVGSRRGMSFFSWRSFEIAS